jgi:hypothetical protein
MTGPTLVTVLGWAAMFRFMCRLKLLLTGRSARTVRGTLTSLTMPFEGGTSAKGPIPTRQGLGPE